MRERESDCAKHHSCTHHVQYDEPSNFKTGPTGSLSWRHSGPPVASKIACRAAHSFASSVAAQPIADAERAAAFALVASSAAEATSFIFYMW